MEASHRALVTAEPASLRAIRRAVRGMLADLGAPPELVWEAQLAVNEPCTGLLLGAFPDDEPPGLIEVAAAREPDGTIVVSVTDDGLGFDPVPHSETAEVALAVLERTTSAIDVHPSPYGRGTSVELRFAMRPPPRARRRRRDQAPGR